MGKTELLSPTDVMAAVFAALPLEFQKDRLPTDTQWMHTTFAKLKKAAPKLFRAFAFDESDMYPYSPVFDEALSNLQIRDNLLRKNPEMVTYDVNVSAKRHLDTMEKGHPEDFAAVQEISKELVKEIEKIAPV